MTCKGLNCHVSIIQERKDHYEEKETGKKAILEVLRNILELQYPGEEAEGRFAAQEVSEI